MTLEVFILGLVICSAFTSLVTEGIKKLLEKGKKTYNSNVIAAISAIVVAVVAAVLYAVLKDVPVDVKYVALSVLLSVFSWLGAMVGYDKVIQTIGQIVNKKKE